MQVAALKAMVFLSVALPAEIVSRSYEHLDLIIGIIRINTPL